MEKSLRLNRSGRKYLSEWFGQGNGRTAILYVGWQGYSVDFLLNDDVVESRSLWEHSRDYAEDACENWVMEIIK